MSMTMTRMGCQMGMNVNQELVENAWQKLEYVRENSEINSSESMEQASGMRTNEEKISKFLCLIVDWNFIQSKNGI